MGLTLEEIAKRAGVSRSTVSRVVNNDPHVHVKTRRRVLAVTQKLDYQPNLAARGLAAGRTRVLGLVIPMGVPALFTDPYFPILIQGISAACNTRDHSVMLWLAEAEYERRMMRQILQSGLIDGVIVASALVDDAVVDALEKRRMPFVLVGRHPTKKVNYVDVDNRASARDMVNHLIRLGYKRVATIAGPQNMIAGLDRLDGYKDALRASGGRVDPNLIVEAHFTEDGGYTAMQKLVAFNPDAVFCASDAIALGAMRALREAGKRVPEDVALAGFDDMPFAARTVPPLTSVRQPIHRAGMLAAETLIDLVEHPDNEPRQLILPTELVIRESCGANLSANKQTRR